MSVGVRPCLDIGFSESGAHCRHTVSFIFLFAIVALAQDRQIQDRRQNAPGQFDFYASALSWSPSFCEASQERTPNRPPDQQCGGRPFSFVVHGLWPQYSTGLSGLLSGAGTTARRLNRRQHARVRRPSPRLIFHEWDRHGTCSGLSSSGAYLSHRAQGPRRGEDSCHYLELDKPITVTSDEVVEAFVKINPGLSRAAIAVACDSKRLCEVRVCLGKDFGFRECAEVTRRACRRDKIVMPAVRSG